MTRKRNVKFPFDALHDEGITGLREFMKILVGYDGSEYADNALNTALDLAEKFSASITVLSVMPPLPSSGRHAELVRQYDTQRQTNHERTLSAAVQSAQTRKPHLTITSTLIQGDPVQMILDTAHAEAFDLIVMGSRGRGGLMALFLGSVSHGVVNGAKCSTLIVK